MSDNATLLQDLKTHLDLDAELKECVTLQLEANQVLSVWQQLRDHTAFKFEQLIDVCGVDYLEYGLSEWRTREATATGFSRAKARDEKVDVNAWTGPRFAVVYHFLSVTKNHRLRVKVFLDDSLLIPSVVGIWTSANWFEREAFDLFGIVFDGHPDLRRLLTDYGFKGHPFRKDFPLIGEVEMRYDAATKRCVYEPVSIQPRINVPKVIRKDNRYQAETDVEEPANG
jgi:NADH-quinone oxidoreductase subunit C